MNLYFFCHIPILDSLSHTMFQACEMFFQKHDERETIALGENISREMEGLGERTPGKVS